MSGMDVLASSPCISAHPWVSPTAPHLSSHVSGPLSPSSQGPSVQAESVTCCGLRQVTHPLVLPKLEWRSGLFRANTLKSLDVALGLLGCCWL